MESFRDQPEGPDNGYRPPPDLASPVNRVRLPRVNLGIAALPKVTVQDCDKQAITTLTSSSSPPQSFQPSQPSQPSKNTDKTPLTSTPAKEGARRPISVYQSEERDVVVHTGRQWSNRRGPSQPKIGASNIHHTPSRPGAPSKSSATGMHNGYSAAGAQTTKQLPPPITPKANGYSGNSPKPSPTDSKQSLRDELNKLRQSIVLNAHLNHHKDSDHPAASPEVLAICRTGAGTIPDSDIDRKIAQRRFASTSGPQSLPNGFRVNVWVLEDATDEDRWVAQQSAYERTSRVYPVVVHNVLHLSTEPTTEYEHFKASKDDPPASIGAQAGSPNSWESMLNSDWEYQSFHLSSRYEGFRDLFRRWFDSMPIGRCVDIYHSHFFNGMSHSDGEKMQLVPGIEELPTLLDPDDAEACAHRHETSDGYCYNWIVRVREEKNKELERKEMERLAYLEAMKTPIRNPNAPKANIYLRPAESADVPQLLEIFNWYASKSPLSPYFFSLKEEEILEWIDTCRRQKLPFIVAVERKTGPVRNSTPENILGYALASDRLGAETTGRFTAELQLFVRHGHKRLGIGSCLMDKLLEVCDPTYIPKLGYFFDASLEERSGYGSGGRRKLARLIFTICYGDRCTYQWLMDWLKTRYEFEEQGVIKGERVKFDYFYFVRTIGYSRDGKVDF
ncbi:hypothetical protein BDV59DRAFT_191611 [Aspergillus ambiguus]|uniref:GNAT family N-acetyltransferase n=1 Tax=Aspergillus ambiguus TaxID=176160 RepID=UPI003CCE5193